MAPWIERKLNLWSRLVAFDTVGHDTLIHPSSINYFFSHYGQKPLRLSRLNAFAIFEWANVLLCFGVHYRFYLVATPFGLPYASKPYGPKPYAPKRYAPKPYASQTYVGCLVTPTRTGQGRAGQGRPGQSSVLGPLL